MRLLVSGIILAALASVPARLPRPGTDRAAAGDPISAAALKRDLFAFADDSMLGRETGTPNAQRAAAFIATRLASLGLEPAGDSGYYQRVPLVREQFLPSTSIVVTSGGKETPMRLGVDLVPYLSLAKGKYRPRQRAHADIVFVSYALTLGTLGRSDFAGLDVFGKVVVVLQGAPPKVTGALATSLESEAQMGDRISRLIAMRPAAIVVLMTARSAPLFDELVPGLMREVRAANDRDSVPESERLLPMVLFGVAHQGSPFLPDGWPADDRSRALSGRSMTATIDTRGEPFTGYNVVGVVRGTDPSLSGSYVAYGAHYDHIGVQLPSGAADSVRPDSIANGADDDGSGTVALLAIAERMMGARPKRSVLFVWHVAEEKGLLGSAYFVAHPTVPIDSIVAQLDADMIGRNEPSLLYIIGPRAAPNNQSRALGVIVDSVNRAEPRPFVFDRDWDRSDDPQRFYQRSDHFNYANVGIPIIFFTTGLHVDYHTVSDSPEKIDYDKLARVAGLMLDVGTVVADRSRRPRSP